MSAVTVFVNGQPVSVPEGSQAAAAVGAFDPALAARLAAGAGHITDARGIDLAPDTVLRAGSILRVVVRARQGADADA